MGVKVRKIRGKWYIVVDYRGRRKTKLIGSEERAREVARKLETALELYGLAALDVFERGRERALPRVPTLREYAGGWKKELRRSGKKSSTITNYLVQLDRHLIPAFGPLRLDEIDYLKLKTFAVAKAETYRRDSVRLMIATLRLVLAEAVREGHIKSNPVTGLGRLYASAGRRKERVDPFTLEELRRLEETAQSLYPEHYPLILLLSRTGMRIGEARGLQWGDVDFEGGRILIRRSMGADRKAQTPKTASSERSVDISAELVTALRAMKRVRMAGYLSEGETELPDWVFVTREGTPLHYNNFLRRVWNRLLAKAKVRRRTPHDLRHTWASQMLAHGEDLAYVSSQLGHKHPGITLAIYTHWIPGVRKVGSAVFEGKSSRAEEK